MVAEIQGDATTGYLRGVNLISITADTTEYYLFNAHGDVVNLTNSAGATTKTYDYDAFGNERNPDAADENPFRYCGEYWDTENGTYYLRARYYDPAIGRFTQADTHWNTSNMIYGDNPQKINEREDKLGLKAYSYAPQISAIMQAGNLYVYCGNNPIYFHDPTGNAWYHWVLGGAIVVAAAVAVVVTAGGALPAMYAVSAVSCGAVAATTSSTIAAGVFIGSATVYGSAVFMALDEADSLAEFNASGDWWTVIYVLAGAGGGFAYARYLNKEYVRNHLSFDSKKLQHEYKHAKDYGVTGNWNSANQRNFEAAIRNQIESVTNPILGTYRGNIQVYHFYNPQTGINTMIDMNGNFVAGWKLSADQIYYLLTTGNVQ